MSRRDTATAARVDGVPLLWCVLITTARARVPAPPDTPTMAELGTKDLTFIGWFGLLAPTGTPPDILDKLNAEAKAISQTSAYRERMQRSTSRRSAKRVWWRGFDKRVHS